MDLIKQAQALTINNPTSGLGEGREGLNNLVGVAINIAFAAAGLLFLAMFFVGGIGYITAGGDPKSAQAARDRLKNALIGLIVVVAAFAITQLLLTALGLDSFGEIN